MKRSINLMGGAALLALATSAASAATMTPDAFDLIVAEGQRSTTIGGMAVSNADGPGNGDVGTYTQPGTVSGDVLLIGRAGGVGSDTFAFDFDPGATYRVTFEVAESTRDGASPFEASLSFAGLTETLSGSGMDIESFTFAPTSLSGHTAFTVQSSEGFFDYDVSIAAVPLPASLLLLGGGLGVMGALGRRKRKAA